MADEKKTPEVKKVKVKIMAHVGKYQPGDIAEVPADQAEFMCEIRKRNNGHELVEYRTAMLLSEYEAVKDLPIDKGGLSQFELAQTGEKANVVKTPADPKFEAQLAARKKALEKQRAKEMKAAGLDPETGLELDEDEGKKKKTG